MRLSRIPELQRHLGMSAKQIASLRIKHHRKHGKDQGEAKLEAYLVGLWRECRDEPRIPARQNGLIHPEQYVSNTVAALPDEPESPDREWLAARASDGWANFGVVQGEEQAKREARSRSERLRQAELELREKGKSAEQYAQAVEDAIAAMKREAQAA